MSRRVAYRTLSEEGYRVLEADSCVEALDVLSQARGRVDLLLVDVVMPECDGVELARRVLEEWPDSAFFICPPILLRSWSSMDSNPLTSLSSPNRTPAKRY